MRHRRVALTAASIYTALQRNGIRYINPPASFEESGQKIRTPDRVLDNKLGTCLDLAVLTAACLEQAGLHALIAFVTGHAFVGVWLDEECRSRKSRIRPLPMRVSRAAAGSVASPSGSTAVDQTVPSIGFVTHVTPIAAPEPVEETPATRLDRWKRKLLDLTMNNRLLNFRETKKTLPVLCPDLSSLEDALADGETFRVFPRPTDLDDTQRDADVHRIRTGDDALKGLLRDEIRAHRLRASVTDTELSRRLVEIYREARTSLEENGANTLYLALGFLSWYESESSQQRRMAPIILVPLEMERKSIQEGFSINQGDDDPIVNITLLELLKHDFQLSIPGMDPIPHDDHGVDVSGILTAFKKAVKNIDRWEVVDTACIGHFSFTKFLMWRDLEVRTEELMKNKVVSHLINTPHESYDPGGPLPDPDALDDSHKPSQVFCPMEADSSQLAAVCAAGEDKSFVLHGPPGTGKSQTITNLIAHSLANGKSVLFVSEKMAALSVVHRRLVLSGLGTFCLEVHSNKSHKKEVIDQLGAALDGLAAQTSEEWLREANRLSKLRGELNAYVRSLHKVRETGETVFQGLSRLSGLRQVTPVSLGWPADKKVDRDVLDRMSDLVNQLQVAAASSVHPTNSVWAPCAHEEWSPGWRSEVESSLEQLRICCQELRSAAQAVAPLVGMGAGAWPERDLRALSSVSKALLDSPIIPEPLLTASNWETTCADAANWILHGRRRNELRSALFGRYSEALLQLDLDSLIMQLTEADKAWFLPRALGRRGVKGTLTRVCQPGQQVDQSSMLQDLETTRELRAEESIIENANERAGQLFGPFWCNGEADWDLISQLCESATALRKLAVQVAGVDIEAASVLRKKWALIVSEGHEQLALDGPVGTMLKNYIDKALAFAGARSALESKLAVDAQTAWGDAASDDHLQAVALRVEQWSGQLDELRAWCYWRAVRQQAVDLGLQPLIDAYEQRGLPAGQMTPVFQRSFYQWWVDRITDSEQELRTFFSREFERKVQQFQEVDKRYTELTRNEVQARLAARLPRGGQPVNQNSEMGILQRERQKQRRHMPLRQLFQKIPNLLPRLKPCLLMSPMSVAQYLDPAHPPFDLVVFDEASQIPVWDAVGAIARGTEVVIVGDPKQLPPTNFFARSDEPEAAEDDIVEDLESILDDCIAAQLPTLYLRWHYRSRHESLIAFSNYHYYDNRLLTFPSPSQQLGVSLHRVNGVYDKSKSRTNRAEAEAVVTEVLRRLSDPSLSRSSIGIVTFSISQQTLIEDLLDEARRANPDIEAFFNSKAAPNNEPVFVKNLENVQGDERDAILFSICYGPDALGRVSMNFGPMNRDGGERRLNVAITRARREVLVFSTLRSEQIDLSRTRARGVADLKNFLDYAERGTAALSEQRITSPDAECESIFEEQVCQALRERGHTVHSQVGCSGYRIDLAVVDPENPGRYLLGIECDGANYHRAKTARDRDRLREIVLKDLGWRLHRIWSTDWWEKPDEEISRIQAAIENAKKPASVIAEPVKIASAPVQLTLAPEPQPIQAVPKQSETRFPIYAPYKATKILGDLATFYEPTSAPKIIEAIEAVVKHEAPISLNLASKRVADYWGIGKVGPKVAERIALMTSHASVARTSSRGRTFLWRPDVSPGHYRLFRIPGPDEASKRSADDIPPEEIANAALYVLESHISMPVDDLVSETARIFGFGRTGQSVAASMRVGLEVLIKRGDAAQQGDIIVHDK